MTTIKSIPRLLLACVFAITVFSCNNNADAVKEEPKKAEDTVKAAAVTPAPAAFTPFDVAEISHTVKDYAKWRPVFDADSANRSASGLQKLVVSHEDGKPNNVLMVFTIADVAKAKAFAADPKLKETMTKGGVVSKPAIHYYHLLRFNENAKEKQWVQIVHKVKDFDAWLKVYDAEGKEKRMSEGMEDVVLGRGIDDPNTVIIVFDIKAADMAKAKAALASEEKKKLMMSAGVEGTPTIQFYTDFD